MNNTKSMDFRTEWYSWVMVLAMIGIAVVINPWYMPLEWTLGSTFSYLWYILSHPLFLIGLATIPVIIICWIAKIRPDLDYCIWLAFAVMLILLAKFLLA